jgi:PEP-CTERM motif
MRTSFTILLLAASLGSIPAYAGVLTFGDQDCLGQGCYASDPKTGATLQGLAPNVVTLATNSFSHGFPFSPDAGDFPGTDTIYVGSVQTASHDGYSAFAGRVNGADVLTLDYSSLIGAGQSLSTLTLGIAADDFQFQVFGQPFIATVNGSVNTALTSQLNSFNQSGPVVQFFTIGLDPTIDTGSHILTISIDEGGDGGDGFAVDFLTVGATTASAVPEPSTSAMLVLGFGALVGTSVLRCRRTN